MSTSSDLREALTQRLKRMESISSVRSTGSHTSSSTGAKLLSGISTSVSNRGQPQSQGSTNLPALFTGKNPNGVPPKASSVSFSREPSLSPSASPVVATVRCEGYLSKHSSGSITGRWQRRFFVLQNGRLGYYKKAPSGDTRTVEPEKSFSLRKVKEVIWNEAAAGEREFSLRLADLKYQLKASTPSEMRKWVSAINTAIAQKDSLGYSDNEDNASSSAVDLASVSNSVSSVASDSTVLSEDVQAYLQKQRQMAQASSASRKLEDTLWEVEVDPDELDRSFAEWFVYTSVEQDDVEKMSNKLNTGILIALSHLYSTIGSEVFDAHLITDLPGQLKRARGVIQSLRRSSQEVGTDPIKTQLNSIFLEYITRIINEIVQFLDIRKDIRDSRVGDSGERELITIIDTLAQTMRDLCSFTMTKSDCDCAYCSPEKGTGETCTASDRWKKTLRNILQRLGSEMEVTLIEKIQDKLPPWECTWEAEPGSSSIAPNKISHSLFGTRLSVWLSGWSTTLISTCEQDGFSLLRQDTRTKHCKRLIAELVASVLVAVLNSAWRQFKRKIMKTHAFAEQWKQTLQQIAHLRETNTGFWSIFSSQHHEIERLEHSCPLDETYTLEMANLIGFGNEAILISSFLTETVPEQLCFIPKIFESCFEGLASAFSNTAADVATHVVHFHFSEKCLPEILNAFKTIQTDSKRTPMIVARDATEKFASDLVPFGTHPTLKSHIVNSLPAATIQMYVSCLLKSRPKVKQIKSLATVIDTDLIIFKSLFSETRFNCKDSVVNKAMPPLTVVQAFLAEKNKTIIMEELPRRLVNAFGVKYASQAGSALLDMRGPDFSKSEKITLMTMLEPNCPTPSEMEGKASSLARLETASYLTDSETVWRF